MEIGTTINQYKVVEHIGRGGMADVWSARDSRLNRLVAIKTIARNITADVDPVAMFEQEAQTIAQMEHPHILPIYDFGDFKGTLYIVMRYVTGGSLDDRLKDSHLTLDETIRIGGAVAAALHHAHQNNVIHLDLKPANILMDSGGSPYLADFGLATVLDPQGRAKNPGAGTLLYMAPEQLTADVIDHRADIFSFGLLLFHMLTGELPFESTVPLALKQLQGEPDLPDITDYRPDLPPQVNDVLRRATASFNEQRPASIMDVIDELQSVTGMGSVGVPLDSFSAADMATESFMNIEDAGLLEAVDIYARARHVWFGGRGRFLLGVTHFMLIADFYRNAAEYDLSLDLEGRQMLLRGALEYDYDVNYWWDQLDDDNRRWVCLHAVRSENAPARIRALYRLETLPDEQEKPMIPRLVAQALDIEAQDDAKIAALQVLGTRARLLKPHQTFEVQTQYRGQLLSTITRSALQIVPQSAWHDTVYSLDIDRLIARLALDEDSPDVAEFAARTVGRMRSLAAVQIIAHEQAQGNPDALRVLALVRDEAPSLPHIVSRQARAYAWITNTVRRAAHDPLQILLRFMLGTMGGAIAMGQQVYITYRSQSIFDLQRWGNAIAIGLLFGIFIGVMSLLVDEIPSRLRGFWSWGMRLLVSAVLGLLLGILTWTTFISLYLQYIPDADLMRFAGFGLAFGFILMAIIQLPRRWQWLAIPITALATYIPLYYAFRDFMFQDVQVSASRLAVLYYDFPQQIFTVGIPFVLTLAIGAHAQRLFQSLSAWVGVSDTPPERERSGWLAGMLLYVMGMSSFIGIMAIFSAHVDVFLAVGWSMWGMLTFVFALAAWNWKTWGFRGLILSAVCAVAGGFWFDIQTLDAAIFSGQIPGIFEPSARVLWFAWALVLIGMLHGVRTRKLWSALGLIGLNSLWLVVALFTDIQESGAIFAAVNGALLLYAILPQLQPGIELDQPAESVTDSTDAPSPARTKPDTDEKAAVSRVAATQMDARETAQITIDSGIVDDYDPDDMLQTADFRTVQDHLRTEPRIDVAAESEEPPAKPPTIKLDTSKLKNKPDDSDGG